MDSPPRSGSDRWEALDGFRALAVALMVQGHTFTALLRPEIQSEPWYAWHRWVHGFTAPMFLFGAGLAFGVTTLRQFDAHAHWGEPVRRRVARYLTILAIGYVLHLPEGELRILWDGAPDALWGALQVDALHVIAVTMLCLVALTLTVDHPTRLVGACMGLALLLPWLGPFLWRAPVTSLVPPLLAPYFTAQTGSLFPFIPWAAYVFAGVAVAGRLPVVVPGPGVPSHVAALRTAAILGGVGLVACVGGTFGLRAEVALLGPHDLWQNDPFRFVQRVGVLVLLLGGLGGIQARVARPLPRVVRRLAGESLIVYVAHLLVLFGVPFLGGLEDRMGGQLGLGSASLVAAGVFLVSFLVSEVWVRLRARYRVAFARLPWIAAAVLLGVVFLRW